MGRVLPLDPRVARSETEVEAPVDRVWRALTHAADLESWFPVKARVEPGRSGRLHFGWGDRDFEWDIEAWDRPHHLRLVPVTPTGGSYLTTDLFLRGGSQRTHLRVATSGFPAAQEWDELIGATGIAYRFLMLQLRYYLEHHEGQARQVVSVRRRVELSPEEAWRRVSSAEPPCLPLDRVLDRTEPCQVAALSGGPAPGLMRLGVDPAHPGSAARDVSVWYSSWNVDGAWREGAARAIRAFLARHFADGEAVVEDGVDDTCQSPPQAFLGYALNGTTPCTAAPPED